MKYPEHEKLTKISEQSQFLGEFMEFLGEKGYVIAKYTQPYDQLQPVVRDINNFLAEMFDIDLIKIEAEKREMLEDWRKGGVFHGN